MMDKPFRYWVDAAFYTAQRIALKCLGRFSPVAFVFSFLFSATVVLGSKIVFNSSVGSPLSLNYFKDFLLTDLLFLFVLTAFFTVAISQFPHCVGAVSRLTPKTCVPHDKKTSVFLFFGALAVILLGWLPTFLTYAPGSVLGDSLSSIKTALSLTSSWSNHNPVLYTLFVKAMLSVGMQFGDINVGVLLYTCVQYLIMAASFAYSILWLAKKRVPRMALVLIVAYYAVVPIFSAYAVTMWKDPLFGTFIFLYSLFFFDVIESKGALLKTPKGLAAFVVLSLLIIFFRNNGFMVVIGSGLALALVFRRSIRLYYVAFLSVIVVTAVIQGPVFDMLQVEKPFVEAVGVPIQQMAYVISTDGNLSDFDKEFLYRLLPQESWEESYTPCLVDSIKWDSDFDEEYLEANKIKFLKVWFDVFLKNPVACVKSYCLETFGYWKIGVKNVYGFTYTGIVENTVGIRSTDLFEQVTGTSLMPVFDYLRGPNQTNGYVSTGLIVWVTFLSAAVVIMIKRQKFAVVLAPCIFSWVSIMIAAPVAFSLRYLFMMVATLPVIVLLPLLAMRSR